MAKTIALILLVAILGVGLWALSRSGQGDLREQAEESLPGDIQDGQEPGNTEPIPPGEPIDDVQVISAGPSSAYGRGAVSSGDQRQIQEATRSAIVTADTSDQFNLAWELLINQGERPQFDGNGRNAIFAFLGLRPGPNFGLRFTRAEVADDGSLNIFVDTIQPRQRDFLRERELTSPYLVLSVPESEWRPDNNTAIQLVDDDGDRLLVRQTWQRGLADQSKVRG